MRTQEIINGLPKTTRERLYGYAEAIAKENDYSFKMEIEAIVKGYVNAIYDLGMITRQEARILRHFYMMDLPKTINRKEVVNL